MILRKWQRSYPPYYCFTASILMLYIPIGKWYFMLPIHPQENNRKAVVNVALSQRAINTAFYFWCECSSLYIFIICYMCRDNMIICSTSAALSFCAFKICWNTLWQNMILTCWCRSLYKRRVLPSVHLPLLKGLCFPRCFSLISFGTSSAFLPLEEHSEKIFQLV